MYDSSRLPDNIIISTTAVPFRAPISHPPKRLLGAPPPHHRKVFHINDDRRLRMCRQAHHSGTYSSRGNITEVKSKKKMEEKIACNFFYTFRI